jgi:hypothetical protein
MVCEVCEVIGEDGQHGHCQKKQQGQGCKLRLGQQFTFVTNDPWV